MGEILPGGFFHSRLKCLKTKSNAHMKSTYSWRENAVSRAELRLGHRWIDFPPYVEGEREPTYKRLSPIDANIEFNAIEVK